MVIYVSSVSFFGEASSPMVCESVLSFSFQEVSFTVVQESVQFHFHMFFFFVFLQQSRMNNLILVQYSSDQ